MTLSSAPSCLNSQILFLVLFGIQTFRFGKVKPWSPNLQIWNGVQTFRFGMESKPSDLEYSLT